VKQTRTTCPYCGVGCGVIAEVAEDGAVKVFGDPNHPANFGKLCSKGLALAETLQDPNRLLHPVIHGEAAQWPEATRLVADRFAEAINTYGPDSVAFYVSGQLLTEDYYVANKLMKGYIGSANIDTNSRLCMSSAVAGHKRAFGEDVVPCSYEDLEQADLVVLVGSNLAWCHPVLFQRLLAAREHRGTRIIVIDPRRTPTAESADLHLALKPQSDVALFNGLLRHFYTSGEIDGVFVTQHTQGLSDALVEANAWTPAKVSEACGLAIADVTAFFKLFALHAKTVTAFSMGVNQSASGTDKVNAIINCHLLTGRIGKAGAGPFSITGQPNAMGGREVGGLANMLAAHLDIENAEHRATVQDFWQSPRMADKPGLKAVDLFEAVHAGQIKALWIMATNPVVSMPNAGFVAEALRRCPFVVVSDVSATSETAKYGHVLLPAQGWSEKDGTVTNSDRHVSRQRTFLPAVGEARPDWRIISDVAQAMGFEGFAFDRPAQIYAEHARLTQRAHALGMKLHLEAQDYEHMSPTRWGEAHVFADGVFPTASGKANFIATRFEALPTQDFTLNTGRIRDQWHTMTRTGLVPRLFSHRAEPYLEIAPADAKRLGITPASLVTVTGPEGDSVLRALVSDAVKPGDVFQPMHWSGTHASGALANSYARGTKDPVSGQPALKSVSVDVKPFAATWYGFGISIHKHVPPADYCAWRPLKHGMAFECAGLVCPEDWTSLINFGAGDLASLQSSDGTSFRCAITRHGRIVFAFFASAEPVEVSRSWLEQQLLADVNPLLVLAGRPHKAGDDQGAILCSCMHVGGKRLAHFIAAHPAANLETVCRETGAGTGCGSCRVEIRKMIHENARPRQAAE
jgi:assimilatory nitrate reductase catalytic subunit